MPTSLVAGGAGFIGSHIVDLLIEKGHKVVIIDNLSTGNEKNLNPKAKFYDLDIRDQKISEVFQKEKPDFVFHLAAQIDLRRSVIDPIYDSEINILGSLNILDNCSKNKVKKILFPSSGTIYGEAKILPTPESYPPQPLSPYAINKLAIEKYLYYYSVISKPHLEYIILRLGNIYGPRQNSKGEAGVISIFIDKILNDDQPIIFGDGEQTRDYTYVKDVANAFLLGLDKSISGEFNIGTEKETSVNEIYKKIAEMMGKKNIPSHGKEKDGDQKRICLSRQKALKSLGWTPRQNLDKGIEETVQWFKSNKQSLLYRRK